MKRYGLIGRKLSHSFSKEFFEKKFISENVQNCSYGLFELENEIEVKDFLLKREFDGLNVTIPYKETVIPYLDILSEEAKSIGAVNCIKNNKGKLIGFNTDAFGFSQSLKPCINSDITKAIVFGSGGASKAVNYVLDQLGIEYLVVSRNPIEDQISYSDLDGNRIKTHKLIINTTPLGMYPNVNSFPDLPYDELTDKHLLFDLVYNPKETAFLSHGKRKGAQTVNGEKMLILQAEKSWALWNNHNAQDY